MYKITIEKYTGKANNNYDKYDTVYTQKLDNLNLQKIVIFLNGEASNDVHSRTK